MVERYFQVNCLTQRERLTTTGVCMEGETLHWLPWRGKRQPFSGWEEFKNEVLKRFEPDDDGTPYEELLTLRQMTTVQAFQSLFEVLSLMVDGLSEETLTVAFMNGLLEEIQAEVKLFYPLTLEETMERARQVENKNFILNNRSRT